MKATTTIVVIGASGDLAKKKTYPALFKLFKFDLLVTFFWMLFSWIDLNYVFVFLILF